VAVIRRRPDARLARRGGLLAAALALAAVPALLSVGSASPAQARDPLTFRIATFNVLGDGHTAPYAHDDNFAPSRIRAEWMADVLDSLGSPDIVGMQEVDAGQLPGIMRATQGRYDVWPGTAVAGGVQQSVMWRTDTWTATVKDTIVIPFIKFQRAQPVVKLENKATGRSIWVINVHNAPRDYQSQRNQALKLEVAKIKELRKTGLPVFLVGDFNEKNNAFCKVVGQTDLTTPMGGSATKDSCDPPGRLMRIDWIFGGADIAFDDFAMNRSPLKMWTNDHLIPVASVTVP
jgi:endonuclease/exonuclease/phosphatase family metal-dependent hydrolase